MKKPTEVLMAMATVLMGGAMVSYAYEALYDRTAVGTVEVKEIPGVTMIEASSDRRFFDGDSKLFMTLFRYIQKNDIPMTVPVESDMDEGNLRFLMPSAGRDDLPRENEVVVRSRPAQWVVSVGLRGAYREKLAQTGMSRINNWLDEHPEYEATGQPYGVYWNSPFVPGFLKRSEVHLPVRTVRADQK